MDSWTDFWSKASIRSSCIFGARNWLMMGVGVYLANPKVNKSFDKACDNLHVVQGG